MLGYISAPFSWLGHQATKLINTAKASDLWLYTLQVNHRVGTHFITWLMRRNGLEVTDPNNPIWPYVLGPLTEQAMHDKQVATKDLMVDLSFSLFGYQVPLRFRGFTLMSVYVDRSQKPGRDLLLNFSNAPARGGFDIPAALVGLPNFVNRPWSKESATEKALLKGLLAKNELRLMYAAQQYAHHVEDFWDDEGTAAQNITLMTLRIIAQASFGLKTLPKEVYPLVDEFESIWQHPEHFSAQRLKDNRNAFMAITRRLTPLEEDKWPPLQSDFAQSFYDHHKRLIHISGKDSLNIASFLAIFGNLPKAVMGLFYLVMSNPDHRKALLEERQRLEQELAIEGISPMSKEGFEYILSHSECYERYFYEVMRYWFIAPVLPRLNNNLLFNQVGAWGDPMKLDDDHSIPPRALAIYPLRHDNFDPEKWSKPEVFNPERDEYTFKQHKDNGRVISTGQKPIVFGYEGSKRGCPGQRYSRTVFFALMHQFCQLEYQLSPEEIKNVNKSPDLTLHHMAFEPNKPPIVGVLHTLDRDEDAQDLDTERGQGLVAKNAQGSKLKQSPSL